MTSKLSILLLIAALTACQATPAPTPAPPSTTTAAAPLLPLDVVQRFRDALRAEMVPAALFMLDEVNYGSPAAEQVRLRIKRLAEEVARGGYDFKPIDQHIEADCAAVIVRENPGQPGPAQFAAFYLIHRGDGWKLSPEPASFERMLRLTSAQATTFRVLERWFQLRKADLKLEERATN